MRRKFQMRICAYRFDCLMSDIAGMVYFMPLTSHPRIFVHRKEEDFDLSGLSKPYGLVPNRVGWK